MKKRFTREVLWLLAPVLVLVSFAIGSKQFRSARTTLIAKYSRVWQDGTVVGIRFHVINKGPFYSLDHGPEPRIVRVEFSDGNGKRILLPVEEALIRNLRANQTDRIDWEFDYMIPKRKFAGKTAILEIRHWVEANGAQPTLYSVVLKRGNEF